MGRKITIDSATLMNKGLEVIEARWLFGVGADRIDVVVHPQSVVHSMVEFVDGSSSRSSASPTCGCRSSTRSRIPSAGRRRFRRSTSRAAGRLEFEPPDTSRFPCLALAYRALAGDAGLPVVLNAANEVAVAAFLERPARLHRHPRVIERDDGRVRSDTASPVSSRSTTCARSTVGARVRGARDRVG